MITIGDRRGFKTPYIRVVKMPLLRIILVCGKICEKHVLRSKHAELMICEPLNCFFIQNGLGS